MKTHIHKKDEDGTLCSQRVLEDTDYVEYGRVGSREVTCGTCLRIYAYRRKKQ